MRHFAFFSDADDARLFHTAPQPFGRTSSTQIQAMGLGATLYMPSTRPQLATDLRKQAKHGVTSCVVCLEDSIADDDVALGERNIVELFQDLAGRDESLPMTFIRIRHPSQAPELVSRIGPEAAHALYGFVLPKFTSATAEEYLRALDEADDIAGTRFYSMPVLESGAVLQAETRATELLRLAALLGAQRRRILAIRLGATDLCALYGLRRSRDQTIWDIKVVADLLGDVVNVLGRADGSGFAVTGPVWEYFSGPERLFKPQLRQSPFDEHNSTSLRKWIVSADVDGLIREVELDRANGLQGKTVIHPTHVPTVHALSVVALEEYLDACDVVTSEANGGAQVSGYRNKMNEIGPHRAWARVVLQRAEVFGVAAEGVSFVDLLTASYNR